jgi:WD40 repeat protein
LHHELVSKIQLPLSERLFTALSPDGMFVATLKEHDSIKLWRALNGKLIRTLGEDQNKSINDPLKFDFSGLAFSQDSSMLGVGTGDDKIFLWRVEDGLLLKTITKPELTYFQAFSPDGVLLAYSHNYLREIFLAHISDGSIISKISMGDLPFLEQNLKDLVFSPNGKLFATFGGDNKVVLWSVGKPKIKGILSGSRYLVQSISFTNDGKLLAACSEDGTIYVWNTNTNELQNKSDPQKVYPISCIDISPDNTLLASGGLGPTRIWKISDGSLLKTLMGHRGIVNTIAFSPGGELLATGSADHTIFLWKIADGRHIRTLEEHSGEVRSVIFSPNGNLLASVGQNDKNVCLWRVKDGTLFKVLEAAQEIDGGIAFSPDGKELVGTPWGDDIYVWEVQNGRLLRMLSGYVGHLRPIAYSPDGSIITSCSNDRIYMWNAVDGSLIRTIEEHLGFGYPEPNVTRIPYFGPTPEDITNISISPDGELLASASRYGMIGLWKVADGSLLKTLTGGDSVKFSANGALLASGSESGTIKLWGVPPF